jgi:hypothetical protein
MQVQAMARALVDVIFLFIDEVILEQQLPLKICWLFTDKLFFSHLILPWRAFRSITLKAHPFFTPI